MLFTLIRRLAAMLPISAPLATIVKIPSPPRAGGTAGTTAAGWGTMPNGTPARIALLPASCNVRGASECDVTVALARRLARGRRTGRGTWGQGGRCAGHVPQGGSSVSRGVLQVENHIHDRFEVEGIALAIGSKSASKMCSYTSCLQHSETELCPCYKLRGKVFMQLDGAGVITNSGTNSQTNDEEAYDFKGNQLHSSRQLAIEYKQSIDWLAVEPSLSA
jgi:hypothetical protein